MWLNLYGHEAVRHGSKIGKKRIFCVFRPFLSLCPTTSWPYSKLALIDRNIHAKCFESGFDILGLGHLYQEKFCIKIQ